MDTNGDQLMENGLFEENMLWYALQTYSGQENKAKAHLEKAIEDGELQHKVREILVPTEEVTEMRNGKQVTTRRKFYPGYVLIQMVFDEETSYLVTDTPGVSRFLGGGDQPQPLKDSEIELIIERTKRGATKTISETPFEDGDSVMVVDGPFSGFSGVVEVIDAERGKVRVMVTIFGRATPVDLEFAHVKPL